MFMPELGNIKIDVPPSGNPSAKIAVIGDYTDGFEVQSKRPFSGPSGKVFENLLHTAGLIRGEIYTTNLIKKNVPTEGRIQYFDEKKTRFTERGMDYVRMLQAELSEVQANVLVAAGPAAFAALCSLGHLTAYRGYVFPSTLMPGKKVIPIHNPRSTLYKNYTYRHMIVADLRKAKVESAFPELRRPERELVYRHDCIEDVQEWFNYYYEQPILGFDIEVINYEVSCISFASTPELACVIPISERWNLDEEMLVWRGIQKVLGNPDSIKVIQNSMFDVPFLLSRNGIITRGVVHDTMIAHSIMYPELPKALGFLGSIYCGAQEYWKDTVKFKSIKDED